MRSACLMLTCLALLSGCGGDDKKKTAPAATQPQDSEDLKIDMLEASALLDTYRLEEKGYTADEKKLGDAFPKTVTVKEADKDSFYMAARDDQGVRYVLRVDAGKSMRTCDPPKPGSCPKGKW